MAERWKKRISHLSTQQRRDFFFSLHGAHLCVVHLASSSCRAASLLSPLRPRAFYGRCFYDLTADVWSLCPPRSPLVWGASHSHKDLGAPVDLKHKNPQSRVILKGVRWNSLSAHSTGPGWSPSRAPGSRASRACVAHWTVDCVKPS